MCVCVCVCGGIDTYIDSLYLGVIEQCTVVFPCVPLLHLHHLLHLLRLMQGK